jgi:hypothetical protein
MVLSQLELGMLGMLGSLGSLGQSRLAAQSLPHPATHAQAPVDNSRPIHPLTSRSFFFFPLAGPTLFVTIYRSSSTLWPS